jgi:hypothetical protein
MEGKNDLYIYGFKQEEISRFKKELIEITKNSWNRIDKDLKQIEFLKIDYGKIKNYSKKSEESTMKFWQNLPSEIQKKILTPKDYDLSVMEFMEELINDLHSGPKIDYWWSRSNTFDPIILWQLAHATGKADTLDLYLKFWRVRDVRTYIDAKFDFSTKNGFCPVSDEKWWKENFIEHDSRYDIAADVLRLQAIHRAQNELPL